MTGHGPYFRDSGRDIIRAVIVHRDCSVIDAVRESLSQGNRVRIVAECHTPMELDDALARHRPGLLLIGRNDLEGLRKRHLGPGIVTLAIDDTDSSGMCYCDIDYITSGQGLRAVTTEELVRTVEERGPTFQIGLDRFANLNEEKIEGRRVAFKSSGALVVLPVTSIYWIEKAGDGTLVQTADRQYATRVSVAEFSRKPQLKDFVRTRQNLLLNPERIREIKASDRSFIVTFENGAEIGIARAHKLREVVKELCG